MPQIASLGFHPAPMPAELIALREKFLKGEAAQDQLDAAAHETRLKRWTMQHDAGVSAVPCGDFTWEDPVADTMRLLGITATLNRPLQRSDWFGSGLHYSMPDMDGDPQIRLAVNTPLARYGEATKAGFAARPVLLGPLSFLLHGRRWNDGDPLQRFDSVLAVYVEVARSLAAAGAEWIQLNEPALAQPLSEAVLRLMDHATRELCGVSTKLKIFLAAPYGGLGERLVWAANISIHALHLDLVADPAQLDVALNAIPSHLILSLGMVSGSGVEIPALSEEPRRLVGEAVDYLGDDRVWLSPSTPLSPMLEKAPLAMDYLARLRSSL